MSELKNFELGFAWPIYSIFNNAISSKLVRSGADLAIKMILDGR